jgi:hypothetical protein
MAAKEVLVSTDLELNCDQGAWLEVMTEKYGTGSPSKTLRVCILHAQKVAEVHHAKLLWQVFRCRHCGIRATKMHGQYEVYPSQLEWLNERATQYRLSARDKALRVLLDFDIMCVPETELFQHFTVVKPELIYNSAQLDGHEHPHTPAVDSSSSRSPQDACSAPNHSKCPSP